MTLGDSRRGRLPLYTMRAPPEWRAKVDAAAAALDVDTSAFIRAAAELVAEDVGLMQQVGGLLLKEGE